MDTVIGQLRPSNTTAAAAYTKPVKKIPLVSSIFIANTTTASAKYSIYLDADGTTYNESTALFFNVELLANSTALVEFKGSIIIDGGSIGVKTDTANALTFTIFGEIKDVA